MSFDVLGVYQEAGMGRQELPKPPHPTPAVRYLDGVENGASLAQTTFNDQAFKRDAANVITSWLETDDLDEGETLADRLKAMFIGVIDMDKDGELSDDEQSIAEALLDAGADYLASKGVSDEDITALLDDWDTDAADRVLDFLAGSMPDGEAADDELNGFVFDAEAQEPLFDAVYKKKTVIRNGRKILKNVRISGTVHLSAKVKANLKRMQLKAQTAQAKFRRARSNHTRLKMGL